MIVFARLSSTNITVVVDLASWLDDRIVSGQRSGLGSRVARHVRAIPGHAGVPSTTNGVRTPNCYPHWYELQIKT